MNEVANMKAELAAAQANMKHQYKVRDDKNESGQRRHWADIMGLYYEWTADDLAQELERIKNED